jgi:predicted branched-subunit amino acid permease
MGILGVGGPRPPGVGSPGGWDFWVVAGFLSLLLLLLTDRRRLPAPLTVVVAALGGLVLSDLTHAWGVVPVWGVLLLVALARNLRRGRSRPQV